jgi:hypothetical protein
MKVYGPLESSQLENLTADPGSPAIGRIYMNTSNPTAGDPRVWTGSTWLSLNPASFSHFTGTVGINQGGTGQVTAVLGFNALSPLTTKGDILGFDGTNNVRVPVGTNGYVATANSALAAGWGWAPAGSGGNSFTVKTKTANYTAIVNDVVLGNATGGSFAVTLPDATLNTNGVIVVKRKDSTGNVLTVNTTGGQTIDGLASTTLPSGAVIWVISDGANWYVI